MSRISKSVIAFVTIHLIAAVTTQEMEKRAPQGFLGMRGKKYDDGPDQYFKRKPQFFVGVKGKKDIDMNMIEPDYFKRAPMGFVGMRGKKDDYDGKRAPMGFVGMRGKKELFDDKRAPLGFVGMRGKKEFDDSKEGSLIGQIDYAANSDNDFPLLNQIITEYLNRLEQQDSESEERITNEVEKRAAGLHQFFGVRGKKSLQSKRPYDVSFRGKFIGVRGKKDVPSQEIKFLLDQGAMPKRKGAMGFIGMRGKKWDDESSPETMK